MRERTVTVREGELLGPVDWEYDFRADFDEGEAGDKRCEDAVAKLRLLADGGEWEATTDGGVPRFGWGKVLAVGMYDGWPHWRPVPSVLISGLFGGEWASFRSITDVRPLKSTENERNSPKTR